MRRRRKQIKTTRHLPRTFVNRRGAHSQHRAGAYETPINSLAGPDEECRTVNGLQERTGGNTMKHPPNFKRLTPSPRPAPNHKIVKSQKRTTTQTIATSPDPGQYLLAFTAKLGLDRRS